jgi:ADP-heptose:LPS heptosyltransferase
MREDFDWISLQKDIRVDDARIAARISCLRHYGEQQRDFADAVALIENCDLVISVDTSIAHLAGAMGKEVWVLLPKIADWRWMLDREDSPWYPRMRLFRQRDEGDWAELLSRVADALECRFS